MNHPRTLGQRDEHTIQKVLDRVEALRQASPQGPTLSASKDSPSWVLLLPTLAALTWIGISLVVYREEFGLGLLRLHGLALLHFAPHLVAALIASTAWISLWTTAGEPTQWKQVLAGDSNPILLATPRKVDRGIRVLLLGTGVALIPYALFAGIFLTSLATGPAGPALLMEPLFLSSTLLNSLSLPFFLALPGVVLLTAGLLKKVSEENIFAKMLLTSGLCLAGYLAIPFLFSPTGASLFFPDSPPEFTLRGSPTPVWERVLPWLSLTVLYISAFKIAIPPSYPKQPR